MHNLTIPGAASMRLSMQHCLHAAAGSWHALGRCSLLLNSKAVSGPEAVCVQCMDILWHSGVTCKLPATCGYSCESLWQSEEEHAWGHVPGRLLYLGTSGQTAGSGARAAAAPKVTHPGSRTPTAWRLPPETCTSPACTQPGVHLHVAALNRVQPEALSAKAPSGECYSMARALMASRRGDIRRRRMAAPGQQPQPVDLTMEIFNAKCL